MASVTFRKISKSFKETEVLHNIDFKVNDQEFLVLVGPSGCGKSTLLRILAGLETLSSGEVYIDDRKVNDLPPRNREIAMVFQDYALYPHMSVKENLSFGLRIRRFSKKVINERIEEAAAILQIEDLLNRRPKQLSGGQRQRVAIGRAIVRKPKVFLFDEPLSNLDAKLRGEMRIEFAKLHQKLNSTVIYVTHDQIEAMTLGNRIAVMNRGYIQQIDTPSEIFSKPQNSFVAGFIGSPTMNFIDGNLESMGDKLEFTAKDINLTIPKEYIKANDINVNNVLLGVRPEDVLLCNPDKPEISSEMKAIVDISELLGNKRNFYLNIADNKILATGDASYIPETGTTIPIWLNFNKIHLFNKENGNRLN